MPTLKKYIGSPFLWYSVSWIIVVGLYSLEWTEIYPTLKNNLLSFLIITTIISLCLTFLYKRRTNSIFLPNPLDYYPITITILKYLYILLFIECIHSHSLPIIDYLRGNANINDYQEFGIPFIHVLLVNSFLLLFNFSSYCYFSMKSDVNKFLIPVFFSFISPIIFMSRGTALFMIFVFLLMFIITNIEKSNLILIKIASSIIVITYLFGLTGNLRLNDPQGEYILEIGGASDSFKESIIPNDYFWTYVYIVTPLGNLQNVIDEKKIEDLSISNPYSLLANSILPQSIGKRLGAAKIDNYMDKYRVVTGLTVGTTYFGPYIIWGWPGMIIIFIVMMLYCVIMLRIVPVDSIFNVPLLCVLSTMTFFSLFDNMVIYMAIFPQLVIIVLLRNNFITASDET